MPKLWCGHLLEQLRIQGSLTLHPFQNATIIAGLHTKPMQSTCIMHRCMLYNPCGIPPACASTVHTNTRGMHALLNCVLTVHLGQRQPAALPPPCLFLGPYLCLGPCHPCRGHCHPCRGPCHPCRGHSHLCHPCLFHCRGHGHLGQRQPAEQQAWPAMGQPATGGLRNGTHGRWWGSRQTATGERATGACSFTVDRTSRRAAHFFFFHGGEGGDVLSS